MKQIEEQKDTMDFNMSVPSRSPSFKEIKLILWVNAGVTVLAVLGIVFVMAAIF
jgi:hypothetical protein